MTKPLQELKRYGRLTVNETYALIDAVNALIRERNERQCSIPLAVHPNGLPDGGGRAHGMRWMRVADEQCETVQFTFARAAAPASGNEEHDDFYCREHHGRHTRLGRILCPCECHD